MGAFRRFAFAITARDTTFVAVAAATLMLAFSFAPALALTIGANIALLFAIGLLLRAACLSERRIDRTEAWRSLRPQERPVGDAGRRSARDDLQEVLLRFAKRCRGCRDRPLRDVLLRFLLSGVAIPTRSCEPAAKLKGPSGLG